MPRHLTRVSDYAKATAKGMMTHEAMRGRGAGLWLCSRQASVADEVLPAGLGPSSGEVTGVASQASRIGDKKVDRTQPGCRLATGLG